MTVISGVALEKIVRMLEVGDSLRLADMLSTSGLGPLLNETSLDEALPDETLLIEALLTEILSGVV